jgi:peptide deformylase
MTGDRIAVVRTAQSQRGLSLIGLLVWAIVIAMGALIVMRVVPTVNEYYTIQRAVDKVAKEGGNTVPEIRNAFERQKQIEYSIQSISGSDLEITKRNEKVVISFAYDKEVELFAPVYLLIKYKGESK